MISTPHNKYQQSSVQTASPAQLVLMLYDGAIRFTKQGIDGIETKDYMRANAGFIRAQQIVNELVASLDHNYPVASNLIEIYDYLLRKLMEANMRKNKHIAQEVVGFLSDLREAWAQASKTSSGIKDTANG